MKVAQQYSAINDAVAAWRLVLYEVWRPTLENQCSCAMPVKQSTKLIPVQKQTAFQIAFSSEAAQTRSKVSEWCYRIKALAHKSKHCAPSKTNSPLVLPMRSIPFRADCHPNRSRGGTTANSGQYIFKTEPANEINVASSKALNICNNRILLWGGFVYLFALK